MEKGAEEPPSHPCAIRATWLTALGPWCPCTAPQSLAWLRTAQPLACWWSVVVILPGRGRCHVSGKVEGSISRDGPGSLAKLVPDPCEPHHPTFFQMPLPRHCCLCLSHCGSTICIHRGSGEPLPGPSGWRCSLAWGVGSGGVWQIGKQAVCTMVGIQRAEGLKPEPRGPPVIGKVAWKACAGPRTILVWMPRLCRDKALGPSALPSPCLQALALLPQFQK